MKLLAWMLIALLGATPGFSQEEKDSAEIKAASTTALFSRAASSYAEGKYQTTIDELNQIEGQVTAKAQQGLVAYWKGISYNRLQDFPKAIQHFDRALGLGYAPVDLNYEYGQALFASEKLEEARLQFRESLKKKFKRGVSLYYIAYVSAELGDKKKAVTFYKAIDKLGAEGNEVRQSAQVQIGDIYLAQVEKTRDAFRSVEQYVIPQYRYALSLNETGPLAPRIREKILDLQKKYDLILFKLRNGRPVQNPPYFLRAAADVGYDTNVIFAPAETTVSKSKQGSMYARGDFLGRYTFYYRDYLSLSPELRFNRTHYLRRIPEIYRNDNYLIAPGIRSAYEHTLWKKPASVLFDYDYAEARRDVRAREELEFSSRSHSLMIGERFNLFSFGETTLRLRYRIFESFLSSSDSRTWSVVTEQIAPLSMHTLLFYLSYDRTRVENGMFHTDSFTFRTDLILARFGDLFTPSFGLGLTTVDPIIDRKDRGRELLINPSVRLTRTFGKRWRGNLKYEYQNYDSKDKANFAYKKSVYGVEFEYLF